MTRTPGSPKLAITTTTTRRNANVIVQPNVRTGSQNLKTQSVRYIAAKMHANACRPVLRMTIGQTGNVELPAWLEAQRHRTAHAVQIRKRCDEHGRKVLTEPARPLAHSSSVPRPISTGKNGKMM
jgi:hypothetical protein